VASPFRREVGAICGELRALVGKSFSLAITPRWGESLDGARDRWLLDEAAGVEVLLHGLTHRAPGPSGPLGWLTGGMNELGGLPAPRALARLAEGRARLLALGLSPAGAVAPAWDQGAVSLVDLEALGLGFSAGLFAVATRHRRVMLATRSWDTDRLGLLSLLGEGLGEVVGRAFPAARPQVVLHPLDLRRGWLGRGLACVRGLLDRGLRPATLGQIVGTSGAC